MATLNYKKKNQNQVKNGIITVLPSKAVDVLLHSLAACFAMPKTNRWGAGRVSGRALILERCLCGPAGRCLCCSAALLL